MAVQWVLLVLGVIWLASRWRARKRKHKAGVDTSGVESVPLVQPKTACDGANTAPDLEALWQRADIHGSGEHAADEGVEEEVPAHQHKFGAARSELYKLTHSPIQEDTTALIQAISFWRSWLKPGKAALKKQTSTRPPSSQIPDLLLF